MVRPGCQAGAEALGLKVMLNAKSNSAPALSRNLRQVESLAVLLPILLLMSGCSMSEEVRRIEQVKQLEQRRNAASSTDLTGKQIFVRSCNTCHPGGRRGFGPALDQMEQHFPSDQALKSFIRKGKGAMPAQPKEVLNDRELDALVYYLRSLNVSK